MRKVIVVDGKSQSQTVINEFAGKTLLDIKSVLSAKGVSYEEREFIIGSVRTKLIDDASQLPEIITKGDGSQTTDLIILMNPIKSKIKSGMAKSRAEVFAEIKAKNLQKAVVEKFGKNFTMCKTSDLEELLSSTSSKSTVKKSSKEKVIVASVKPMVHATVKAAVVTQVDTKLVDAITALVDVVKDLLNQIDDADCITDIDVDDSKDTLNQIKESISGGYTTASTKEPSPKKVEGLSKEDLKAEFGNLLD